MSSPRDLTTDRSTDPAGRVPPWPPRRTLFAVDAVLLLLLGFAGAVTAGLTVSWLGWMWAAGGTGRALAVTTLVLVLLGVFAGCRVAAYGMESAWGAVMPAVGWFSAVLALTGYTPGGDIVLPVGLLEYGFLFGGIAAVTLAAVLSRLAYPAQKANTD